MLALSGCQPESGGHDHATHHDHEHDHAHEEASGHGHQHVAPHGGAAVVLGDELYHLEFVANPEAQAFECYVLDGHMEDFVRIAATEFEVVLESGETWLFQAQATGATGETVGDTSYFRADVSDAAERKSFAATVKEITVKGSSFTQIPFRFPEGNEG